MNKDFNVFYKFLKNDLYLNLENEKFEKEAFGNKYATFSFNEILVRIVLDRSEFRIEFAGNKEPFHFFDSDLVLQLFDEKKPYYMKKFTNEEIFKFLSENLISLNKLFTAKNYSATKNKLNKMATERWNKFFKK